jgi:hypothetical protein
MRHNSTNSFRFFSCVVILLSLSSCEWNDKRTDPRANDIVKRLARLKQVPMKFDARQFSERKKQLLKSLIEAGQLVHEAYLHQVSPEGVAIRDSLLVLDDDMSLNMLRLIDRNGGIYDKIDGFKNFFGKSVKPPGAGFYSPDLTKEELEGYLALRRYTFITYGDRNGYLPRR